MGNLKWLTIDSIKQQLRVDTDCEDALMELYGAAAEDAVLNTIGKTYTEVMEEYGEVPAPMRLASLMIVTHSYEQRSPASTMSWSPVPYTFELMLKPYMRLTSKATSYRACNNF